MTSTECKHPSHLGRKLNYNAYLFSNLAYADPHCNYGLWRGPPEYIANTHRHTHTHPLQHKKSNYLHKVRGFPGGTSGKEPLCQCRRLKGCRSDSWVGEIPWRRAQQPKPVFLPGETP